MDDVDQIELVELDQPTEDVKEERGKAAIEDINLTTGLVLSKAFYARPNEFGCQSPKN